MDINCTGLLNIAGIISFLITGDTNGYKPGCLCKECDKILIAAVVYHLVQCLAQLGAYIKYSSLPWKGSSDCNISYSKFQHRK